MTLFFSMELHSPPTGIYTLAFSFSFNIFDYFEIFKYKIYSGLHEHMRTLWLLCVWRESKFLVQISEGNFPHLPPLILSNPRPLDRN